MLSARFAVALALLVAVAAAIVGTAGLMMAWYDEGEETGRLVSTRITNSYEGDPVLFPLDEFYFARGDDERMRALYLYPPGFFGHTRGCKVVWIADEDIDGPEGNGPGYFVDPCGGARFTRDGELAAGPADRGLDYFETSPGVEGIVVDTRTLWCGPFYEPPTPVPTDTPTPVVTPTIGSATPIPTITPFGAASATPTPTETATARPTRTPTGSPSPTPDVEKTATYRATPRECDRVTADTRR
jgi:hypothetical protein